MTVLLEFRDPVPGQSFPARGEHFPPLECMGKTGIAVGALRGGSRRTALGGVSGRRLGAVGVIMMITTTAIIIVAIIIVATAGIGIICAVRIGTGARR